MGRAFKFLCHRRRTNFLSSALSGSLHILSFDLHKDLFGHRFLDAMVTSAEQDQTIAFLQPKKPPTRELQDRNQGRYTEAQRYKAVIHY